MNLLLPIMALAAVQAPAAVGPQEPPETRYRRCADQVRTNPAQAVDAANQWLVQGGSLYARQCLGLAYVALERWEPAATVYEQAASEVPAAQDALRADLFVQAGNAWIAAAQPTRAILAFDQALTAPGLTDELRGEVHLDRARALVALDNPAGARQDLDRAVQLVPADPFAWYLSAALARREGNLSRARVDIGRALEIAPDNPDMQLLAGTLAGLAGDLQEAERLYRRVAERAPDGAAGRAARASLETLREVETPATVPQTAPEQSVSPQ
ncbi:MAG TPA: tetratricopeptide repeat protein [Allosphingosinicella sp.]|nr:tetratricopeptide repeat protein [Allosphingosinicella sp.]